MVPVASVRTFCKLDGEHCEARAGDEACRICAAAWGGLPVHEGRCSVGKIGELAQLCECCEDLVDAWERLPADMVCGDDCRSSPLQTPALGESVATALAAPCRVVAPARRDGAFTILAVLHPAGTAVARCVGRAR